MYSFYRDLTEWILQGFNATLVTYGEQATCKTATLFGFKNNLNNIAATKNNHESDSGSCFESNDQNNRIRLQSIEGKENKKGMYEEGGIVLCILKELFKNSYNFLHQQSESLFIGSSGSSNNSSSSSNRNNDKYNNTSNTNSKHKNSNYSRTESNKKITIALSAWSLSGFLLIDLLSSVTKNDCVALEFATIECPTYEIAVQVRNKVLLLVWDFRSI